MVQTTITQAITETITLVQLPLPYDLMSMNCYLVEGEKGLTIIDTGDNTPETQAIWKQVIQQRTVERIVITHGHTDHLGCANWLRQTYGAPVYMYEKTHTRVKRLQRLLQQGHYINPTDEVFALYGVNIELPNVEMTFNYENYVVEPDVVFTADTLLPMGDETYRVIFTPGHSEDHVCFYNEQQQVLFLGDHLLESMNPVLLPTVEFMNPITSYLATFDYLETLQVKHALPGHLQVIANLPQRIERLRQHYEKRLTQVYDAVAAGHTTFHDITIAIYQKGGHSTYSQVIAMLHYLVALQKITRIETTPYPTFALLQ